MARLSDFTEAEIDAAVLRSNAAMAAGRFEEGIDALASVGVVQVRVGPDGKKLVSMDKETAAMIRRLAGDES